MIRIARLFAISGLLAAAAASSPAGATSLAPLSVDQMVDASHLVVVATVREVSTMLDYDGRVYTHVEVEVERAVKGPAEPNDFLTIEVPGGVTADGDWMLVPLAPRYSVDERALLFLAEKRFGSAYGTVGLSLGKYTVKQNPSTGTDMVVRFTVPYDRDYDARFIPNPPANERVSLDSMLTSVEARVAKGWDGRPIPGISLDELRTINKLQPGVK